MRDFSLTSDGISELEGFKYHSALLHSTEMRHNSKGELVDAHIHIRIGSFGRTEKRYPGASVKTSR
jgi:hypothetical protein